MTTSPSGPDAWTLFAAAEGTGLDALAQPAQQAADRFSRGGSAVWYRSVTFVPQDEMSLFLFEGVSPRSVTEAIERTGLSYERVVGVVHLAPGKQR